MSRARDLADIADKDITGTLTADGLTSSAVITAQEGRSNTAGTGQIVIDPDDTTVSAAFRLDQADNKLNIDMTNAGTWQKKLSVYTGGDISFYEDTGTTPKFFWDASAESLGIGTISPQRSLSIGTHGTSSSAEIAFGTTTTGNASLLFGDGLTGTDLYNGYIQYQQNGGNMLFATGGGSERMRIDSSGTLITKGAAVFNEDGADKDFRVESDSNTHMLFVDASTNRISLGSQGVAPNATVCIFATVTSEPLLRLAGTTDGMVITQRFQGANTSGTLKFGDISFVPNAEEINFRPIWNGSNMLTIQPSESTFNQDSQDHDFRVESNSNSHMLFVDAGGEYVNVNTSATYLGGKLNVGGNKGTGSGIPSQQLVVADFTALRQGGGGAIQFNGIYDSNNNLTTGGSIENYKRNATSGDYGFGLQFKSRTNGGTNQERLYMDEDITVFNDIGSDTDFRVESNTNSSAFIVDAGGAGTIKFGGTNAFNYSQTSGGGTFGYAIDDGSVYGSMMISNNADRGWSMIYANKFAYTSGDDQRFINWYVNGTSLCSIQLNSAGTAVEYQTTSDRRLKENIQDITGGIETVKQLRPRLFEWITDEDNTFPSHGFIADEADGIIPEAVTGEANAVDEDGNPAYQSMEYSKLVPVLTAALKEAITKIEDLEARITALENA